MTIAHGSHRGSLTENCVMEHVALEYLRAQGILSTSALLAAKTDAPGCTARWITEAAQAVNDRLDDGERQRLAPLIPRLLHDARVPSDPEKCKRVAVRVACWAARSVLHLVSAEDHEVAVRAIVTAEAWLRGEATEQDCSAAAAAAATTAAAAAAATSAATATATYAATTATAAAAYATAAAAYAAYAYEMDLVLWLDELLDAHVKALAEEGLLGDEDAFEVWAVENVPAGVGT
jgi:hypothetical protein